MIALVGQKLFIQWGKQLTDINDFGEEDNQLQVVVSPCFRKLRLVTFLLKFLNWRYLTALRLVKVLRANRRRTFHPTFKIIKLANCSENPPIVRLGLTLLVWTQNPAVPLRSGYDRAPKSAMCWIWRHDIYLFFGIYYSLHCKTAFLFNCVMKERRMHLAFLCLLKKVTAEIGFRLGKLNLVVILYSDIAQILQFY